MSLVPPYGGALVNLIASEEEKVAFLKRSRDLKSIQLSLRNLCDLELLATGGFSPLTTFMGKEDYQCVLSSMRLANGMLWPIPITLTAHAVDLPEIGQEVALRNANFDVVGVLTLCEVFDWQVEIEASCVFGTLDLLHPTVLEMKRWGPLCISGPLKVFSLPKYYDFVDLRMTPARLRETLSSLGSGNVVAFQTRNPMHRAHEEMTKRAAAAVNGTLLLHPVVGMTKPGDVDHFTRVRSYKALWEKYYDKATTVLSLLPLAMRMGGPKEVLLHAIVRRNYGANYLIVGRDHAGPGSGSDGKPFYGPYDAQTALRKHEEEIGVKMLPFEQLVYVADEDVYVEEKDVPFGKAVRNISGTEVRNEYLAKGRLLPAWFTRPECASILSERYPPRSRQGFCLWFTGLSGSGKSAVATVVSSFLLERGRYATLLDGDVVRTNLSKGLGFSKEDRNLNIARVAFVASEICRHGGVVICATISPYETARADARRVIGPNFIEVFMSTPLAICEERDKKGLYARARHAVSKGESVGFTGVDDPYEAPREPELTLSGFGMHPEETAQELVDYLVKEGFIDARQ